MKHDTNCGCTRCFPHNYPEATAYMRRPVPGQIDEEHDYRQRQSLYQRRLRGSNNHLADENPE